MVSCMTRPLYTPDNGDEDGSNCNEESVELGTEKKPSTTEREEFKNWIGPREEVVPPNLLRNIKLVVNVGGETKGTFTRINCPVERDINEKATLSDPNKVWFDIMATMLNPKHAASDTPTVGELL